MKNKPEIIYLKIGGYVFEIIFHENENKYLKKLLLVQTKNYYKKYILLTQPKKIDFLINIYSQSLLFQKSEDMDIERKFVLFSKEKTRSKKINTFYYISLSQLSFLITQKLHMLLRGEGFMLHCSSVIFKNKAYLFTGPSGIGKSTVVSLLSEKAAVFSDDTVILKKIKNKFYCFQSAIIEKRQYKKNPSGYILERIYFLKQSKKNKTELFSNKEKIFDRLSKQIFSDTQYLKEQIKTAIDIIKDFKGFYMLNFRKNKNELEKTIKE